MLVWDTPGDEARALGRCVRVGEEEEEEEEEEGDGREMTREVEEMDRGWEKGTREESEEEGEGGGKRRCSSSWLSQAPGTLRLRGEVEVLESSALLVTQRRPAKRATGRAAPT